MSRSGVRDGGTEDACAWLVVTDLTRQPVGPDSRAVVYTAVDVETTGLSDQDRIVELAAVEFRGGTFKLGPEMSIARSHGCRTATAVSALTSDTIGGLKGGRRADVTAATGTGIAFGGP